MHSDSTDQRRIPKHKITRAASIAGTGAAIGANYVKYKAKRALRQGSAKEEFHENTAARTFETFSKLKGGPLKVAQMLSLDRNLLPAAYQEQFSKAQYSAPPLSYPLVVKTFNHELGTSPRDLFDTFDQSATAAASIGQVHQATKDGQKYAVKVQYPGVADSLSSDLKIVRPFAIRLMNLDAKSIDLYLNEVKERLTEETDYTLELQRGQELMEQSASLANVNFPKYYPKLSSNRILTMDWIDGVHLDEYYHEDRSQEERDTIGQALWDFCHHQVHTLREFHADPHPGNFLVKDGQLWVIDFGCVKKLPDWFYTSYFSLMSPAALQDEARFESHLRELGLILDTDGAAERAALTPVFKESVELLSRPFAQEVFDFGDPTYLDEIYQFGERTGNDPVLKKLTSSRGSAHALYLNRTYFGLYNLCGSLKARIKTNMPEFSEASADSAE